MDLRKQSPELREVMPNEAESLLELTGAALALLASLVPGAQLPEEAPEDDTTSQSVAEQIASKSFQPIHPQGPNIVETTREATPIVPANSEDLPTASPEQSNVTYVDFAARQRQQADQAQRVAAAQQEIAAALSADQQRVPASPQPAQTYQRGTSDDLAA